VRSPLRVKLHTQSVVQKRIHKVISHAGRSPVVPRIQYLKGERECPDLPSRLATVSVKTTPNRATTEERSAERGKGSYSAPTDDGSKPRKANNQAGKSAMSPTSHCCRGPQLETHPLRYGIAAAVPNNPRTPRIMENLIILLAPTLRHWGCRRRPATDNSASISRCDLVSLKTS
jgi:hypothetical protein